MKSLTAICLLSLMLSGCLTTTKGEKHGVLVKLSKEGSIWATYEGELIRGGINNASGSNGKAFDFTFGQFKSKLTEKASLALSQNKPIVLGYHCEKFVAPWRGETNCFADSLRILN